ncbi:DUF11 domain-containing protein [Nonomuraea jabiensis]|uniref:Putative repeat protein (TIGR01451 family) n=1 Tax=Nonomuraea jabiensis TaxID=882448 RepID=A0A7W9G7U1_9ACTN|nr:DUF11 domain-containing protein [Nonomuraea jabiensis]MBB5778716.1 putative repeat protein (TIGR01451 family) [Nonomuraea jabiensis]
MGMPGIAAVIALLAVGGWTGAYGSAPPPLSGAVPAAFHVPGGPDLRIIGTVSPEPMVIGGESVYAVTVTNAGERAAQNVTVIDTLDRNAIPGPIPDDCSLIRHGGAVACGGPGLTLPAGQSVSYEIPVRIDPELPEGAHVLNRVEVTAWGMGSGTTRMVSPTRMRVRGRPEAAGPDGAVDDCGPGNPGGSEDAPVEGPAGGGGCASAIPDPAPAPRPTPSPDTPTEPAPGPTADPVPSVTAEPGPAPGPTAGDDAGPAQPVPGEDDVPLPPGQDLLQPVPAQDPLQPVPGETDFGEEAGPGAVPYPEGLHEGGYQVGVGGVPARRGSRPASGGEEPEPEGDDLPLAGVSSWGLGLGLAVLLAISLLVWHFSRREQARDRTRNRAPAEAGKKR